MRGERMKKLHSLWKRASRYGKVMAGLFLTILLLNLLACSRVFCDLYTATVFRGISDGLGFVAGLFPLPLGELLMYLGAIMVIAALICGILFAFCGKNRKYRQAVLAYYCVIFMIVPIMLLLYTLNWVIPFRRSPITFEKNVFTLEEIVQVRAYLVNQYNEKALELERDGEGHILYPADQQQRIVRAMQNLGQEYPLLTGYYPPMKQALCSDFLEWMSIGGYTYPYTMEVTYNKYTKKLRYPMLYAHEMSHHKGFYQEDEANFISFLACMKSGDPFLEYTAYREAFFYLDEAYFESLMERHGFDRQAALAEYKKQPMPSSLTQADTRDANAAHQELYQAEVNTFLEQNFAQSAEQVADVGWKTQNQILGDKYYDGVVGLLLGYYHEIL